MTLKTNKQKKHPTVILICFLNVETPRFLCFSLQLVSRIIRNFFLFLKMKAEIHRYSHNCWWIVWMFSWRKTPVVMKLIETMRKTGNMKAQLIKSKINLRNCNFFSKGYLYNNNQEQLWGISNDTLYQKRSECVQNVPFIKLTEHSEVQIGLFEILLQNYDRGD